MTSSRRRSGRSGAAPGQTKAARRPAGHHARRQRYDYSHRIRINTEGKAKVVAAGLGT